MIILSMVMSIIIDMSIGCVDQFFQYGSLFSTIEFNLNVVDLDRSLPVEDKHFCWVYQKKTLTV